MVEPAIGGTLFPQGALEDGRRVKRPLAFGHTWSSRNCKTFARV
jgi:hypothetical protein